MRRQSIVAQGALLFALLFLNGCGQKESRYTSQSEETSTSSALPSLADATEDEREKELLLLGSYHEYISRYDDHSLSYWVRPPREEVESSFWLIVIGDEKASHYWEPLVPTEWISYIPSRPSMNYQLLAEGDFWGMLTQLEKRYPELKNKEKVLFGYGKACSSALSLANDYRSKFAGVIASGPVNHLHYPNLDHFPVIACALDKTASRGWTSHDITQKLEARQNLLAIGINGSIDEASLLMHTLLSQRQDFPSRYSFSDYQHSQAWPWLRVTAKGSEAEIATLYAQLDANTLILQGRNVSSVTLFRRELPSSIHLVRFNDSLYSLSETADTVSLGDDTLPPGFKRKADTPAGYQNFWKNEPLLIVYQDQHPDPAFSMATFRFATILSQMRLSGFPPLAVKLPTIKLSEYRPDKYSSHRALFIGEPPAIQTVFHNEPLPVSVDNHEVYVGGRESSIWVDKDSDLAYALCYPPDDNRYLKLAFIFGVYDTKGLNSVIRDYSSATTLVDSDDLKLWVRKNDDYQLMLSHRFDSYWGSTEHPSLAVDVPPQPSKAWEFYLYSLLTEKTQTLAAVTEPLLTPSYRPPTQITEAGLQNFIPERQLALVTLEDECSVDIFNQILTRSPSLRFWGAQEIYTGGLIEKEKIEGALSLLVDAQHLRALSAEDKRILGCQLLPYSLHELLLRKLEGSGSYFGKELLRVAQSPHGHKEVIR